MKNIVKWTSLVFVAVMVLSLFAVPVFAEEDTSAPVTTVGAAVETATETENADDGSSSKAIAAAAVVGVVAAVGAVAMGFAISKSSESISRQPEAAGNIRTSLMLGLVFIETAIIYALIVAILIIFVL